MEGGDFEVETAPGEFRTPRRQYPIVKVSGQIELAATRAAAAASMQPLASSTVAEAATAPEAATAQSAAKAAAQAAAQQPSAQAAAQVSQELSIGFLGSYCHSVLKADIKAHSTCYILPRGNHLCSHRCVAVAWCA